MEHKTDKELATELAISYITSWNGAQDTRSMQIDNAVDAFNAFYKAVHEKKDEE